MWTRCSSLIHSLFNRSTILKGYSQVNQEPGFIRRIGIGGPLYHLGQKSFTPYENCLTLQMTISRNIIKVNQSENTELLFQDILEYIRDTYQVMKKSYGDIIITQVDDSLDLDCEADVVVQALNNNSLIDTVNNPVKCMSAYYSTLNNKDNDVKIQISNRVLKSSFCFSPDMFKIKPTRNSDDFKELAERTYSVLRNANPTFTAKIKTDSFIAYCENGTISFHTTMHDQVGIMYSHMVERAKNPKDDIMKITSTEFVENGDPIITERYIPLHLIIKGLVNGFDEVKDFTDQRIVDYLLQNENQILNNTRSKRLISDVKYMKIESDILEDAKHSYGIKWKYFLTTPAFKVLMAIVLILLTFTALYSMFKLVQSVTKSKKKSKSINEPMVIGKTKTVSGFAVDYYAIKDMPTNMTIGEGLEKFDVDLQYEVKGNRINVLARYLNPLNFQDIPDSQTCFDSIITNLSNRITTLAWDYQLGDVTVQVMQSEYIHSQRKSNREAGKKSDKVSIRQVKNHVGIHHLELVEKHVKHSVYKTNWNNSQVMNVTNKIIDNLVVLRNTSGGSLYGLALKENYIIGPSHLVSENSTYECKDQTGKIFKIDLKFHDTSNDVAIFTFNVRDRILFKDITAYFYEEKDHLKVNDAKWVRPARDVNQSLWDKFGNGTMRCTEFPGYCNVSKIPFLGVVEGEIKTAMMSNYHYESIDGENFPAIPGDCGTPYLSCLSSFGTRVILGLHSGVSGKNNVSSSISQEYLRQVFYTMNNTKQTFNLQSEIIPEKLYHIDLPEYEKECDVPIIIDDYYTDVFEQLYEPDPTDTIWKSPDNDSNLYHFGRLEKFKSSSIGKQSHSPSPFSHLIDLPNDKQLSIVTAAQLPLQERNKLTTINGRLSPIATQISYYNDPYKWDNTCDVLLKHAKQIVRSRYQTLYSGNHRPLTTVEVINGLCVNPRCQYYDDLDMMDMDTSAGDYPIRKYNLMQKKHIFEEDHNFDLPRKMYKFRDTPEARDIQSRYLYYHRCALRGQRLITVARDNLKREIVKGYKSRVFQSMSVEEVMVFRKYTGTLQASMKQKHDIGHCQIGIDPVIEFNSLARRFAKISPLGEAGDFSRWDKHILPQVIKVAMKILYNVFVARYKGDKQEIKNVFKVLTSSLIYTICECEGNLYMKFRGIPSGVAITSTINCVVNDLYSVMSIIWVSNQVNQLKLDDSKWFTLFGDAKKLEYELSVDYDFIYKNFDWATYGDDKVSVINIKYTDYFNFMTFRQFYNEVMGISYDTPEKDGGVYKIQPINKLQFLSRTFSIDNGVVFPSLKKSTINSFFHWTRDMRKDVILQLMSSALEEASLHDKEYYEQVVRNYLVVEDYCRNRLKWRDFIIPLLSYKQTRRRYRDMIIHKNRHIPIVLGE